MTTLTAAQNREYKRAKELALCFSKHKDVIIMYPAFSAEVTLFTGNNDSLVALVSGKDANGKGITTEKNNDKESVATKCAIICTRTAAYAIKTGNADLLNSVSHSHTEILKLREGSVLGFVTRLAEVVSPLLTDAKFKDYAVTQEMLNEVVEIATSFDNSIGKAALVNSGSSFASRTINKLLKAIRANVKQFGLLLNFFDETAPAFVSDYRTAVAINDTGIRHNGIQGIIKDGTTGAPVKGVIITGEGKNKITVSNIEGNYKLIKIMTGLRQFTFTCPGYQSQTVTRKLVRGKIEDLNITLQSQAVVLSATA